MKSTRKKRVAEFVVVAILISTLTYFSYQSGGRQLPSNMVGSRHSFSLFSDKAGYHREYMVQVPKTYDSTVYAPQHYPVLYLLDDGGADFPWVSGIVKFMTYGTNELGRIPEMIVVAVPYVDRGRDDTSTKLFEKVDHEESEDSTPGEVGNDVYENNLDEIMTQIEANYRTVPYRIVVGRSLGGLLVLRALLEAPEKFQGYIAIDPSVGWNESSFVTRANDTLIAQRLRSSTVYISTGGHEKCRPYQTPVVRATTDQFAEILKNETTQSIRSKLEHFDSGGCGSVALLGLYNGLLSVFDKYRVTLDEIVEEPSKIMSHFEHVSSRLGIELLPPESLVNSIGYLILYELKLQKKALELFRINATNYPQSANVYVSMGEAYMRGGDAHSAIEHLEKALLIDPDHYWASWTNETLRDLKASQ